MAGSITSYDTAKGRRYRVRYRKPDKSQTDKRGFKTKKEAALFLASVTVSKATGEYIDPAHARVTVGSLADAWLASQKVKLKPSSYAPVAGAWNTYVSPRWAAIPVGSIAPSDVADWIVQLQSGNAPTTRKTPRALGATSVLRAHGVLAGILDRAVADRRVPANPARRVPLPRKKKTKQDRHYLTHRQVELLARQSKAHGPMIRFLAYTGLRWGEAIALRVGDIDEVRSRINVRQNAPRVDGRYVLGTPKSHESRSVAPPTFLLAEIRTLTQGRMLTDFVFGDGRTLLAQPAHGDGWFAQAKKRARAADSSFPSGITLHDLRHTAASLAISSGANVKAVQRMLGHASAAMTLDVYADLFDDDLGSVATALDASRIAALG